MTVLDALCKAAQLIEVLSFAGARRRWGRVEICRLGAVKICWLQTRSGVLKTREALIPRVELEDTHDPLQLLELRIQQGADALDEASRSPEERAA